MLNVHTRYLKLRVGLLRNTHAGELCLRSPGPSQCRDELGRKFPLHVCSPWLSLEAREPDCSAETNFSFWLLLTIC